MAESFIPLYMYITLKQTSLHNTMPSSSPILLSPFHSPPFGSSNNDNWFPYRNAGELDLNLAMILIILVCVLVCALALNAIFRCFLRYSRRRSADPVPETNAVKLTIQQPPVLPTLVYLDGMELIRGEAECAICLSEFVTGEGVRVLPKCKHGFHVKCIEEWFLTRSSCPTCRSSCLEPVKKVSDENDLDVEATPERMLEP